MRKVFFVSDTHFNHSNIIKYCHRPFLSDKDKNVLESLGGDWTKGDPYYRISPESVKLMDEVLINNINKTVGADDALWHLGDFAFGSKKDYYNVCESYRRRINCKDVRIVWGNHDEPEDIWELFNEDRSLANIKVGNQKIVLCHYAMAIWEKSHRGSWQLYGHSHSGAEKWLERTFPSRRAMDVGVDNAALLLGEYRPFSYDDILNIMKNKTGHSIDHHKERE